MLYKLDKDLDCFDKKLCYVSKENGMSCKKHGAMLAVGVFTDKENNIRKMIYRCPQCHIGIIADKNRKTDQKEFKKKDL